MKLEDLKKKATTSEMALIDTVEKLVRAEYDLELLKKDIHDKLKKDIYKSVSNVTGRHKIPETYDINYRHKTMNWYDYDKLRDVLYEVGEAVRLELKDEIR